MRTNLILDGNNILCRAYFTATSKGGNANDVTQMFFTMVKSYAITNSATDVYLTWDKRLNPEPDNFRKKLIDYKGNRNVAKETQDDILENIDTISEIASTFGFRTILPYNLEADDVIYFLSKTLEGNNIIVSGDKDIYQLVDSNVSIYLTKNKRLLTQENFSEIVGVDLENFVDYKCILGDSGDNIVGLYKYGAVKSKKLAESKDWDSLVEDQMKVIERNRMLIDLSKASELSPGEWDSYNEQLNSELENSKFSTLKALDIINTIGLTKLKRDVHVWAGIIRDKNTLEEWFSNV